MEQKRHMIVGLAFFEIRAVMISSATEVGMRMTLSDKQLRP